MITYSFPMTHPVNFQKIVTVIETQFQALMHTAIPLPSSLTSINGSLGLSTSPQGSTLIIYFFENTAEYSLEDSSKNIIYQSKPLINIPSELQIQNLIRGML